MQSEWWNIDFATLAGLPFADVDAFLQCLEDAMPDATYKKIDIRNGRISN